MFGQTCSNRHAPALNANAKIAHVVFVVAAFALFEELELAAELGDVFVLLGASLV